MKFLQLKNVCKEKLMVQVLMRILDTTKQRKEREELVEKEQVIASESQTEMRSGEWKKKRRGTEKWRGKEEEKD